MTKTSEGRVAVIAGGRKYEGSDKMLVLCELIERSGVKIIEVVSGACGLRSEKGDKQGWAHGGDGIGERYAAANGIRCTRFYADEYGPWPACGPKRNDAMADYAGSEGVLFALPGGAGTRSMIAAARRHGLEVWQA